MIAVVGLPSIAHADELQDRLVAGARAMNTANYAFRSTTIVKQTGEEQKTIVEQYDPSKPAKQRWTLVSINGKPPSAKEADGARKAKRGPVPAYANLADWLGSKATRTGSGQGFVTYRYADLPSGTVMVGSHDASKDMLVDVRVNTSGPVPFVEKISYRSTRGFRVMLVAKVNSMTVTSTFQMRTDGLVVPAGASSVTAGSMVGKTGEIRSSSTYSNFRKAS